MMKNRSRNANSTNALEFVFGSHKIITSCPPPLILWIPQTTYERLKAYLIHFINPVLADEVHEQVKL